MRALFLAALALTVALTGCSTGCAETFSVVPLARAIFEIEWSEPEARAGLLAAGFDPGELPMGEPGYAVGTNGAVTLISRATSLGSELSVSFVGAGERGLDDAEREEAEARAERELQPPLLSILDAFEEGSTWTRAGPPTWDHATSREECPG